MNSLKKAVLVLSVCFTLSACEGGQGATSTSGGNGGGFGGGSGGSSSESSSSTSATAEIIQQVEPFSKIVGLSIGGTLDSNDIIEIIGVEIHYYGGEVVFINGEPYASPGTCTKFYIPGFILEERSYSLEADQFLQYNDSCKGGSILATTNYDSLGNYVSSSVDGVGDWVSFSGSPEIKILGISGRATMLDGTRTVNFQGKIRQI